MEGESDSEQYIVIIIEGETDINQLQSLAIAFIDSQAKSMDI